MKTVHKFILKSYLGPMFLTFFIVMFILLMQNLWMYIDELVGKGLSGGVIAELIMYAAATMIPLGLPLATLLAAIMTMGNLGENNELLALKAAGISLPRLMMPLVIVMFFVSIGSYFVINDLSPYAFKKMFTLLYDIRRQKQEMEFKDGIFFNEIENMNIRVSKQEAKTKKLIDVLIYDNTRPDGTMITTVADSGYIRMSDDRKYLLVTLFNGETYEDNRNFEWYDKTSLRHHIFDRQDGVISLSGFDFERTDMGLFEYRSETKNVKSLRKDIDSLNVVIDGQLGQLSNNLTSVYMFRKNNRVLQDSVDLPYKYDVSNLYRDLPLTDRQMVLRSAVKQADDASKYIDNESTYMRDNLTSLFRSQADLQKKLALPFSIMIFFLIGAPLGAIIRKGGLGMPIVVSVVFFVIYYIITITGEKFVKDGAWSPILGIWLSSFILFPLSLFLTYKSTNDSAILNTEWYVMKYKWVKKKLRIGDKKKA